jgi:hypothetical protein
MPRPKALQELATKRDQLLEMRVAEQQRLKRPSAQVRKELRQHILTWRAASPRSTMTSTRPCGARRPGAAIADAPPSNYYAQLCQVVDLDHLSRTAKQVTWREAQRRSRPANSADLANC